jgi:hypothetical protein
MYVTFVIVFTAPLGARHLLVPQAQKKAGATWFAVHDLDTCSVSGYFLACSPTSLRAAGPLWALGPQVGVTSCP